MLEGIKSDLSIYLNWFTITVYTLGVIGIVAFALVQKKRKKPASKTTLRFMVAGLAYIYFFLSPVCASNNPVQDFIHGFFTIPSVVFMIPILFKGPGILRRVAAVCLFLPASLYLCMLLYRLIEEVVRFGYPIYCDA